ncbi:MAG: S8 family serine peptidase, partial [Pirellulales bacterium]|nr:S8 family serine peptidase [Pirellulales bacterium]
PTATSQAPPPPVTSQTVGLLETPKSEAEKALEFLQSREFKQSWHLGYINAHKAYARGATGEGEVVAVIDESLHLENDEFDGNNKIVAASLAWTHPGPGYYTTRGRHQRFSDHGTAVASIAVGARGGTSVSNQVQGVAYKAKLAFFDHTKLGGRFVITDGGHRVFPEKFLNDHGAAIVNISYGLSGDIDKYWEKNSSPATNKKKNRREREQQRRDEKLQDLRIMASQLAQTDTDDADKIIYVWAAGNSHSKNSVSPWAGMGVYFPELRGHVLAVTGVDKAGKYSSGGYNKCGSAKDFCLAAPGVDVWAAVMEKKDPKLIHPHHDVFASEEVKTGVRPFGGTSAAAPQVSGALAVMRQYFSVDHADGTRTYQLGNTELVARLLKTANKTGKFADSDRYGQGLLDLDAATAPVGALATSLSTDPNAQPFNPAAFSLSGNAFGGAMR